MLRAHHCLADLARASATTGWLAVARRHQMQMPSAWPPHLHTYPTLLVTSDGRSKNECSCKVPFCGLCRRDNCPRTEASYIQIAMVVCAVEPFVEG